VPIERGAPRGGVNHKELAHQIDGLVSDTASSRLMPLQRYGVAWASAYMCGCILGQVDACSGSD